MARTRPEAAALVEAGRIRLTRDGRQARISKPGYRVRAGDLLIMVRGERLIEARILAIGSRRGPAGEAAGLYEDLTGG